MSDKAKHSVSAFFVSVLLILLTLVMVVVSLQPIFTVRTEQIDTTAYREGVFTGRTAPAEEVDVGLMPLVSAILHITDFVSIIVFQERMVVLRRQIEASALDSDKMEALYNQALSLYADIEEYSEKAELEELLEDEGFRGALEMYYTFRYFVLDYAATVSEILIANEEVVINADGSVTTKSADAPMGYTLSALVVPIIIVAFLCMILSGAVMLLITLVLSAVKNLLRLLAGAATGGALLPKKLFPTRFWMSLLIGYFALKLFYGNAMEAKSGLTLMWILLAGMYVFVGLYRLIFECDADLKIWGRWGLSLVMAALATFALLYFSQNSVMTFAEFQAQQEFATLYELLDAFFSRFWKESLLKLFVSSFAVGMCFDLLGTADGTPEENSGSDAGVKFKGGSATGPIIGAVLMLVVSIAYSGQGILPLVLMLVDAALGFVVTHLLGDKNAAEET